MLRPSLLLFAGTIAFLLTSAAVFYGNKASLQTKTFTSQTEKNEAAGRVWNASNSTSSRRTGSRIRPTRRMFVSLPALVGLGNQMFGHAALLGIARCTGYRPVLIKSSPTSRKLLKTFTFTANSTEIVRDHIDNATRWISNYAAKFVPPVYMKKEPKTRTEHSADADVELYGYFQSWRYFAEATELVLADFRFKPTVVKAAERILQRLLAGLFTASNVTSSPPLRLSPSKLIRVGIHARRGDMARKAKNPKRGYVVADGKYIVNAMEFIEQRLAGLINTTRSGLVYIVCSDESSWAKANVKLSRFPVVHSNGPTAVDMAILASCDHVITTTGSYSWWAGYLAAAGHKDAVVTYYKKFPPRNSMLGKVFRASDYYPPTWIGLT